jgi:precorrin-3B synthase
VLVGFDGRYGIVRNGTARDEATRHLAFAELAADPGAVIGIDQGHGHD